MLRNPVLPRSTILTSPRISSPTIPISSGLPQKPRSKIKDQAAQLSKDVIPEEDGDTIAETTEEEWVTKKQKEVTTTRQIETRVKRQVKLEDGRVIEDSGPMVSTNTTEDTHTQEHHQTEHRALDQQSDDESLRGLEAGNHDAVDSAGKSGDAVTKKIMTTTALVANPEGKVRESHDRTVITHEEKDHVTHMEEKFQYGDVTEEAYINAVNETEAEGDIRESLLENAKQQLALVKAGPRLVKETSATKKIIDSEDKDELRAVRPDGNIVTETKRTTEHEELKDEDLPEDEALSLRSDESLNKSEEGQHRYKRAVDQEYTDYMAGGKKIARKVTYNAQTEEAEKKGAPNMDDPYDWDSLSMRMRRQRRTTHRLKDGDPYAERKDALTKKPIDFDLEEETRKKETSKWLENHFGSDSKSSRDSIEDDFDHIPNYNNYTTSKSPADIYSKPSRNKNAIAPKTYTSKVTSSSKVYATTPEQERISPTRPKGFFQGVSEWSQRRAEQNWNRSRPYSPPSVRLSPYGSNDRIDRISRESPHQGRTSPIPNYRLAKQGTVQRDDSAYVSSSTVHASRGLSPARASPFCSLDSPDRPREMAESKIRHDDRLDYERNQASVERKRYKDRKHRSSDESVRYDSGYRSSSRNETSCRSRDSRDREEGAEEPVPDYSPPRGRGGSTSPSPPPPTTTRRDEKKHYQKTRFAAEAQRRSPARKSVGSAIGNSIRKLVGKIRSASQERRARGKSRRDASRSPSPRRADLTSPSYQQYNVVDNNIPTAASAGADQKPVQRYYLGEDPFAGSIYGRENKYEGARPHRSDRDRERDRHVAPPPVNQQHHMPNGHISDEERRSNFTNTLGRFSHSTSRLIQNGQGDDYARSVQTLPRKLQDERDAPKKSRPNGSSASKFWNGLTNSKRSSSALNVSHQSDSSTSGNKSTNGHGYSQGPVKPARSYKILSRSKSFAVGAPENTAPTRAHVMSRNYSTIYKSNPQLSRLDETSEQLKSPGIVSIINRSQRDLANAISRDEEERREGLQNNKFSKNVTYANGLLNKKHYSNADTDKRDLFLKGLKERAPDLFHTIHGNDERNTTPPRHSTPLRNGYPKTQEYIFKSEQYKRDSSSPYRPLNGNGNLRLKSPEPYNGLSHGVLRRGSNSSDNFSETYRYTTKSDDPLRPSVTNTVETVSKKTIPSKNGRCKEIIESTEKRSVTTSRYKGEPVSNLKYVENSGRLPGLSPRRGSLLDERRSSGQNGTNIKVNYRN